MSQGFVISIMLDDRRAKKNGKFPVKLRVFCSTTCRRKYFPTKLDLSRDEFKSTWETVKPRSEFKEDRLILQAIENRANDVAGSLRPFTLAQFEKKFSAKRGAGNNVLTVYESVISELKAQHRFGSASSYDLSIKSIKDFLKHETGKESNNLSFFDITPEWLHRYERFMTKINGLSVTTVGIYLRALRAVFNRAKGDQEKLTELYPFGKNRYEIPTSRNIKKALDLSGLQALYNAEAKNEMQVKARHFWFLSYLCSGINIKDIALLRWKDYQDGMLRFKRAKTLITTRTEPVIISIPVHPVAAEIINKYGSNDRRPANRIFNIISDLDSEEKNHRAIKNFTRFVNQNLKALARENGLSDQISSYWARHSFATIAIHQGGTMEMVMESLGHTDLKTTQNYFAGFDNKKKRELSAKLLEFGT